MSDDIELEEHVSSHEDDSVDDLLTKKASSSSSSSIPARFFYLFVAVVACLFLAFLVPVTVIAVGQKGASLSFVDRWHSAPRASGDDDLSILRLDESRTQDSIAVLFGSCTAYDRRAQPVWDFVRQQDYDSFIFAGDLVYFDVDSQYVKFKCVQPDEQQCEAARRTHALDRVGAQVSEPHFVQFLEDACRRQNASAVVDSMSFPPADLPHQCAVLGTFDDHDYGLNNGDRLSPDKAFFRSLFLDLIGEPQSSPRRSLSKGIYTTYRLSKSRVGEVQVILLDNRWERDVQPCHTRRDYCLRAGLVDSSPLHDPKCAVHLGAATARRVNANASDFEGNLAFFQSVLASDQFDGTCCRADDLVFFGWCQKPEAPSHPLYSAACDPSSRQYGARRLAFRLPSGEPYAVTDGDPGGEEDVFCSVLGRAQRRWLDRQLSDASHPTALQLVVSGSVVLSNPLGIKCRGLPSVWCNCSSDDWECFEPARAHLMFQLTRSGEFATERPVPPVVVATGDYHYGDVRVMDAGRALPRFEHVPLQRPFHQIMSSGLTDSTARSHGCDELPWIRDHFDTRIGGPCAYIGDVNVGEINVDSQGAVSLTIHAPFSSASSVSYKL